MENEILNTTPYKEQPIISTGPIPGAVNETIYTTDELAAWIRVKRVTLEKSRSMGVGNYPPYIKLGGRRIGYRHIDIMNWMQENLYHANGSRR
jgi:predicted DNA-binding transcriptional regulator AlpA